MNQTDEVKKQYGATAGNGNTGTGGMFKCSSAGGYGLGTQGNGFPTRNTMQNGAKMGAHGVPIANSTPEMISMSSFVPSAHVLSTSFDERGGSGVIIPKPGVATHR